MLFVHNKCLGVIDDRFVKIGKKIKYEYEAIVTWSCFSLSLIKVFSRPIKTRYLRCAIINADQEFAGQIQQFLSQFLLQNRFHGIKIYR